MAFVVPVALIGVPIGYLTWTSVYDAVDSSILRMCPASSPSSPSRPVAMAGSLAGLVGLGKTVFSPDTRYRLFFAKAPSNTNLRLLTAKLGLELLARCGAVFYGAAACGAIAGRATTCLSQDQTRQEETNTSK